MFTLLGDSIDALRSKIDAGKKYIVVEKKANNKPSPDDKFKSRINEGINEDYVSLDNERKEILG